MAVPVGFELSGDPVRAVLFIDKLYFSMLLGNYDPFEYRSLLFNCLIFVGVVFGKPPAADAECLKQCAGALSIDDCQEHRSGYGETL